MASAGVVVADNSFELPAFGSGGWSYFNGSPDGAWTYNGQSGVSNENGPWFIGAAPDGQQAAFCQNNGCSITQNLTGFTVGDFYSVSFYLAERNGNAGGLYPSQPIQVLLGGVDLGTYTPPNDSFQLYTTPLMQATNSAMQLQFVGQNAVAGDSDSALDLVTIQDGSAPEPTTFVLAAGALAALAFRRRSRA